MSRTTKILAALAVATSLGACARQPSEIQPARVDASVMAQSGCAELAAARAAAQMEVARWELPVRAAYRRDRLAVAFGIVGSVLRLRGDGPEAGLYAAALGQRDHLDALLRQKACPA